MENKKLIEKAILFIQKNHKENLSLQNIADNAGFSLAYFDSLFRKHTGYTPVEYSRVYKLTRAALALRRTDRSVLEIALDYGYTSPESFARAFKSFYGMTPSEYRTKHQEAPITWKDLSGKVAISHFRSLFPELKRSSTDAALDYCFTHNVRKHAEDIFHISVSDCEILTLGNTEPLEHFLIVADYDCERAAIDMVCDDEATAVRYAKLLARIPGTGFTIRKSVDETWDSFAAEVAQHGFKCSYGYDMIYAGDAVTVPELPGLHVRALSADDLPALDVFRQMGGCAGCHLRAVDLAFSGKGNAGLRPCAVFAGKEIIALAMTNLTTVRDFRKYDIGGIFRLPNTAPEAIDLLWRFAIDFALRDHACIGNANALEDARNPYEHDSPLSVENSERMGLMKVAVNCSYYL